MEMVIDGIYSATARWDDAEALETLFASLPPPIVANIREGRQQNLDCFYGMRHDEATQRAFYFVTDAARVQVWTFKPASEYEAAGMWAAIEDEPHIDLAVAMRVYRRVTGRHAQFVQ